MSRTWNSSRGYSFSRGRGGGSASRGHQESISGWMSHGGTGTSRPWNSSRGYSSSRGSGGALRGGSAGRGHHQSSGGFPGDFVRIDPDAKFLEDENVEGIHLLTDFDLSREIHVRLGEFSNGPKNFFPAMWPVNLSVTAVATLSSEPYVVGPKPKGPRFLLYVDSSGQIFLENMTQSIFRVDEDHNIKMVSFDGRLITDTVLDGIFTREKLDGNSVSCVGGETDEEPMKMGKLTFVIQDAVRINGRNLTTMGILQRLAFVEEEIMKPRLYALRNRSDEVEAFTLDITEYKEACNADEYLAPAFENQYKYALRSLLFFPKRKGYVCRTCYDVFQWTENSVQDCSFRLKIMSNEGGLFVGGPYNQEIKHDTITLTGDLRKLDGEIVDCRYVDHHWIFIKVRTDRKHPNGKRCVLNKMEVLEHPVTRHQILTLLDKSRGFD